jgi:IS5 family transposase
MKAHIFVDAASGLVHTIVGTAADVNDLNVAVQLLHGEEHAAFGDAGYQGVHKRPEAAGPTWHVAMRPGLRRKLNPFIRARPHRRAFGEDEGEHPRQVRAPVSRAQAPVRLH